MRLIVLCALLGAATFVCLDAVLPTWAALAAAPLVVAGLVFTAKEPL